MLSINMLSKADKIKGQGVLSAHDEQVTLVKEISEYKIFENTLKSCDILHFHTINPEYLLMLPFVKRKSTTVAYVHFVPETLEDSIHLFKPFKSILYKYLIKFYNSMDKLVVVNPYFIDVLENYGIDKDRITYIPNFVSSDRFFPLGKNQKELLRYKYNIDKDKFTVLCVGQLQKRKGILDFIEVAKEMKDVEFLWAGGAVFGKMSEGFNEIQDITQNSLPDNVHFLGLVDRDEMNNIYNIADTMFLPSYQELFPMSILEAMCVNIPVITRDLEIYNGILYDFYSAGETNLEFISIINRLKEDNEFYNQMSEKSKQGNLYYSKENVQEMWKSFYKDILK